MPRRKEPKIIFEDDPAPRKKEPNPGGWMRRHRKWLIIGLTSVLLLVGAAALTWFLLQPKPKTKTVTHTPNPTPTPVPKKASPLTGVLVDPPLADLTPTSVIIENHPDARPQSGLAQAGVVYEANAEGGITRFQAFYLENRPPVVGPVRSLRTYFVDWGLEFDAPVAHAGGNADALDLVGPLGLKSLNALV